MPDKSQTNPLHLPDLSIKGLRGINTLSIANLGRVSLLAGKNGVGKTTVLEACRIYAAHGSHSVLAKLAKLHEEYTVFTDEAGDSLLVPNLAALFHGRAPLLDACIEIGPENAPSKDHLQIKITPPSKEQATRLARLNLDNLASGNLWMLRTRFKDWEHALPWLFLPFPNEQSVTLERFKSWREIYQDEWLQEMEYISLGPDLMRNDEVAQLWDRVALTDDEVHAVKALQLVLGKTVERVAMLGDARSHYKTDGRRAVVKLRDQARPVPLKSLGEAAIRLFGAALALANSRNGFLFIDEVDNSIHYSVQRDFWRLVLKTAHENNVQVLATTHDADCIRGFAQAMTEFDETSGALVRLEKENEQIRAITYSKNELETSAKQSIEVR